MGEKRTGGTHELAVKLEEGNASWLNMGVCWDEFEQAEKNFLGATANQIGYNFCTGYVYNNSSSSPCGPEPDHGDIVRMTVDLDSGLVSFSVNGKACKSVSAQVPAGPVFLAVNMWCPDSEVSLVED